MKQKRSRRGFGVLFLAACRQPWSCLGSVLPRIAITAWRIRWSIRHWWSSTVRNFRWSRHSVMPWIRTESSFNPEATSSIGARGLMQLTEETFDWVKSRLEPQSDTTYDAMYEPEKNIEYGTYLLHALTEQFGSVNNALCAYHAGWGSAHQLAGKSRVFRRWRDTHNSVCGYSPVCGKSGAYLSNLSQALW